MKIKRLTKMTPNEINVLLHYYYSPEAHPRITASAVQMAIDMWIGKDVIKPGINGMDVTNKGAKLVNMLCDTPMPVSVTTWEDPRDGMK